MTDNPASRDTIDYTYLQQRLNSASSTKELHGLIVNAPFEFRVATTFMFLGIIVLLIVDEKTGNINRVALSNTELAKNTTDVSYVPFDKIKIPVAHKENIIALAIRSGKPQDTTDWKFLFEPALTPEQARMNQASGGIAYSAVYPLVDVKPGAALIFSYFQYMHNIGGPQVDFMKRYSALVNNAFKNL